MRRVLFIAVAATFSFAQGSSPCATKCNVHASDCMRACVGDPQDAQRPENAKRLVECMKACDEQNKRCKTACPQP